MTRDLAERAARNMATFEAARAQAHGDLNHQCFLPGDSFPEGETLLKHPVGTYFWLRAEQPPARERLAAGGFSYAFPGILMALSTKDIGITNVINTDDDRLVDAWRLADLEVHPWHDASLNAVLGDIRIAKENPGTTLWALRGQTGSKMVASCMSLIDTDRTAGLYAVGVRGDIQRHGYGVELVRRVTASLRGHADVITLQCHPMLATFYSKVGFVRVGAVEAWSRAQGRIPVDATEAALITAVCGADVSLVQQLLSERRERIRQPVTLWNRGATLLHLASWMADIQTVELLLELGADREQTDLMHGIKAAGWARHFGRTDLLPYL